MTRRADRPLTGVRVVDAVRGPLAAATRYLAELGATVDRVVDDLRDRIRDEASHAGKRRRGDDHPDATALMAMADIVVEDIGVDAASLLEHHPAKVILSISPFGTGNSLSSWRASDAVLHALSGELSRSGIRGREPLLPPGQLAWECAATQAAFLALQSYYFALRAGRGGHIDFAALDGAVQALDPGYGIGGSATLGRPAHLLSRDRPAPGIQYPIFPCADGHVRLCLLSARQWQGMFRWMGAPAAFADPSFNKTAVRYRSPDLLPAIAEFFADMSRAELETGAAAHGVPLSGMGMLAEAPGTPHFLERGAFRTVEWDGQALAFPNGCIVVDGERMTPTVCNDTPCGVRREGQAIERPFEGLKVLDLGVIVVGAETGRLLADQGADVVKVESRAFPDGNRQSHLPYGLSGGFAAGHRNKRSLGLDLRHEVGVAHFTSLVRQADVILSNFKPGTMEALGLGFDTLAAINPRLVAVESSAFGDGGPWSGRMGYGPLVRAATGLTSEWRYQEDADSFSDSVTIYPDHVAARVGALAATALLIRRERTGRGGVANIAQAEVMIAHFGAEIARAEAGLKPVREPSVVYSCRGEDEWCVVTIGDEAEANAVDRLTDGMPLADWMAGDTATRAMERLQAIGIPAARMLRVADLPSFDYYRQRGIFRRERHPFLPDDVVTEAAQSRSTMSPPPEARPAPLAGQHSAEILREWLGLSTLEVERSLASGGVHGVDPEEVAAARSLMNGNGGDVV